MLAAAPASISLDDKSVARAPTSDSSAMSSPLQQTAPLGSSPTAPPWGPAPSVRRLSACQGGCPTTWRAEACHKATRRCGKAYRSRLPRTSPGRQLHSPAPVPPGGSTTPGAQRDPTLGSYLRATKCSSSNNYSCKRRQTFCGSGSTWSSKGFQCQT